MPTYDYRCEANEQVYEVHHPMSQTVSNWAELCEVGNIDPADIASDAPVTRLIGSPGVVNSHSLKNPEAPPCATGDGCCGGANCGFAG